ncbi:hypothetical protein P106B_60 [Rhizobium phage vB_RglS_P106B]|uniref:Uncharacterized protein n=1 Tax=Rhizobium phage vB_RglS_P106B TaxID=1458697 RepID=W6E9R9_9CAUD|nr:hypothetical protein P106B_60 [Rhizobium phage vB_RglS_P106B]AHJ10743.1 hypothetical protein P106B_60 [Rhizobium phage vB_RglS_P106B]
MNTKLSILETGLRLWRVDPAYVTARRIAKELNLTHGAIQYHFRNGEHSMRDAIAFHAVEQGESRVIMHLIAANHKAVAHLDDAQRLEYMRQARER